MSLANAKRHKIIFVSPYETDKQVVYHLDSHSCLIDKIDRKIKYPILEMQQLSPVSSAKLSSPLPDISIDIVSKPILITESLIQPSSNIQLDMV